MHDHDQRKLHKIANGAFQRETKMDMKLRSLGARWVNFQSLSPMDLAVDDWPLQQSIFHEIKYRINTQSSKLIL